MGPGECLKGHIRFASISLGRFDQTKNGHLKEVVLIETGPL